MLTAVVESVTSTSHFTAILILNKGNSIRNKIVHSYSYPSTTYISFSLKSISLFVKYQIARSFEKYTYLVDRKLCMQDGVILVIEVFFGDLRW